MKYVLELLRGKTTYNSRSEAILALNDYHGHRAGQPVVVIYKKNGNSRALLAIGTGPNSYTIIGDADGSIDITSKISARDIVLDEIDYSGLLDDLSSQYADDDESKHRRFGWLGTDKDPWKSTEKIPSGTTVQEAFEAILVGRAQDPEPEPEPITYITATASRYESIYNGGDHKQSIANNIDSYVKVKTPSGAYLVNEVTKELIYTDEIINANTYNIPCKITIKDEYRGTYQFNNENGYEDTVLVECKINKKSATVSALIGYDGVEYNALSVPINTSVLSVSGTVDLDGFVDADNISESMFSGTWNPQFPTDSFGTAREYILSYSYNGDSELSNYIITTVTATLTVEEAPLTVTYTTFDYNTSSDSNSTTRTAFNLSDFDTQTSEILSEINFFRNSNGTNHEAPTGWLDSDYLITDGIDDPENYYVIKSDTVKFYEGFNQHSYKPTKVTINNGNIDIDEIKSFDTGSKKWVSIEYSFNKVSGTDENTTVFEGPYNNINSCVEEAAIYCIKFKIN